MPKLSEILGEAYSQIPEDLQKKYKDIDLVDSSKYVEKTELETANNSIKEYKKQLKDRDKQLIDLKDKAKDSEELAQEIEKLKADNEKTTEDYEAKLNQINFDTKFDKAIAEYKAKNPRALKALLDMEKVKLVEDCFIGLEEQVKLLKETDKYLFEEENKGTGNIGGSSSGIGNIGGFKEEGIGAILGKQKADQDKENEVVNKFFE